jgi:hypothetical protein
MKVTLQINSFVPKRGANGDRRSRPKLRWCKELEGVAGAGCRNWRIIVRAREEWQKLTEETKGHPAM